MGKAVKVFIMFTTILLVGYVFGIIRSDCINCSHFMSRDYTTILKGVAILTVVWAHTGAALGVESIQFIAGMRIALFLICCGYGLELSYPQKGLHRFWKRRFLKFCQSDHALFESQANAILPLRDNDSKIQRPNRK